jgi:UDP-N-acetylmuramate--alanine ligase
VKVHLMGIGGAGVSALARIFLARGHEVSGCDRSKSETTRALVAEGATIGIGHDPRHVIGQDLVVYSGAVRSSEAELRAARERGIRVESRAESLAGLVRDTESITVAGTHGKTTVTFMLGHVLTQAGWDPSVLVGDGASSRAGRGRWLVAEADESDGSLELHQPKHGILTNVEFDHPDHFADLAGVEELFARYVLRIPGLAVICADDHRARELFTRGTRVTYGFAPDATYRCLESPAEQMFHVEHRGSRTPVRLQVPGRHNVQNATGAMAMAVELGVEPGAAGVALATFPGAHRRLERLGTWRGAELYDDYGHHPTEIQVTLAAARELTHGRLVLVFQPHRFSRFLALRDAFAESLAGADELVVTEIYPAGEENPGGVTAAGLAARVPGAHFGTDLSGAREHLEHLVRAGDLVLFMGAGDIWRLGDELAHTG